MMERILGAPVLAFFAIVAMTPPTAFAQTPTPAEASATEQATPTPEELPEQVKALKEKVLESKARLLMLPEEIHGTVPTEAALKLTIENKLSGDYRLETATIHVDGKPHYTRTFEKDDTLEMRRVIEHSSPMAPGAHKMEMVLLYRGHGYGLFPYMKAYEVTVTSRYDFVVPDAVVAGVTATVTSKEPLRREWKDRPTVKFELAESALLPRMTGAPPSPPGHTPQDPDK